MISTPSKTLLKECPHCSQKITRQRVSFDFDFFMCENIQCSFPFNTIDCDEYLIGDRSAPLEIKKIKKRKANPSDLNKTKGSKPKTSITVAEQTQPSNYAGKLTKNLAGSTIDYSNNALMDLDKLLSPEHLLPTSCAESHRATEFDSSFTNILDDLNYTIENPTIA
ncbi:hypothetical protein K7432_000457 [Basidiobolus ranarum]|uniref:Uncharacterized protein n=1 Tax=Basidiobolus ranarum TaxID=34480 RepID=A0ABR2X4N6_9FUNG